MSKPSDSAIRTIERELSRLHRSLEAVRRPAATERFPTMDRAAYVILDVLRAGPRAVGALADELHLDQSTVVRQVAALERKGLVERSADPAGGRAALVTLTPDGEEQLAEVRAGRAERVGSLLAPWPAHDRTELARLLVELNAALDRRLREPPTP